LFEAKNSQRTLNTIKSNLKHIFRNYLFR